MRQLLDKGASIDAQTEDGDTPLSLAVSAGAVGSVGFLVKAGADLEMEDKVRACLLACLPALFFFSCATRFGASVSTHLMQEGKQYALRLGCVMFMVGVTYIHT